jgi:hypothetical protein
MFTSRIYRSNAFRTFAGILVVVLGSPSARSESPASQRNSGIASVQEMIEALTDVWGDAAMRQPNGASYEFFKDLLPPLRWVNAEFHHYPIVLSAPRAPQKTRLVSNGSAINARANKPPMWKELGVPIKFFVGDSAEVFGEDLGRLETPTYRDGYLPVVTIRYKSGAVTYDEQTFAPVDEASAAHGVAMVRFSVGKSSNKGGRIEARVDSDANLQVKNGEVLDGKGQSLVTFSNEWEWDGKSKALVAELGAGKAAELEVFTKPKAPGMALSSAIFDKQKEQCVDYWRDWLDHNFKLVTPEAIVNDAWRATLIANLMIAVGDRPHYSAGNAYDHLYEGECGDTTRSLLLYGHFDVGPGMLKSMLEFNRKDTQFHVAGQKLQLVAFFYWLTRDAATIRALEPLWRQSVDLILKNREKDSGLLPKDRYAGDIPTKVYSSNSNANCWRGLHDLAAVLEEIGSKNESEKLRDEAANYRKAILRAVDRSERHDTKPPYIPIALLADEVAPDRLTSTELGSYYDLICPYIIGSEIFGQGSEREDNLLGYMQNHGGIAMGIVRTERHQGINEGSKGMVPLYALRYNLALLRRDEREKVLVAFYAHLAQGMTRGTFIGGEGNRFLFHADANGREFVLPPNSTSNAAWLIMLRYLLIQDWDLDEDGRPETLRLMYGVPRTWLADGQKIHVEMAPTMFGPVSIESESKLRDGHVDVRITPPPRPAKSILLRVPLPAGWEVTAAELDGKGVPLLKQNSVDLTGTIKPVSLRFSVKAVAEKP